MSCQERKGAVLTTVVTDVVFNGSVAILEGPPQKAIVGAQEVPPLPGSTIEKSTCANEGGSRSKST